MRNILQLNGEKYLTSQLPHTACLVNFDRAVGRLAANCFRSRLPFSLFSPPAANLFDFWERFRLPGK